MPLLGLPAKAVDKNKSPLGALRGNINDREAHQRVGRDSDFVTVKVEVYVHLRSLQELFQIVNFYNRIKKGETMSLEKAVEAIIREAQERGDFDNLKGKGKPIDLSAYFETPEDVRLAYSVLKNAGMVSVEVDLLTEIAALKERLATTYEEKDRSRIQKMIREKQLQFNVMMERQKRQRKEK